MALVFAQFTMLSLPLSILFQIGLFGIIDSHDGPIVGEHVQHHLFDNILNEGGVRSDPAGATRDGYLLTDRNILEAALDGGCSAVTAMLVEHGSRLIVANVGDARAVLAKNGSAVQLSVDHDPGSPTERASVERKGGIVTQIPGRILSQFHFFTGHWLLDCIVTSASLKFTLLNMCAQTSTNCNCVFICHEGHHIHRELYPLFRCLHVLEFNGPFMQVIIGEWTGWYLSQERLVTGVSRNI